MLYRSLVVVCLLFACSTFAAGADCKDKVSDCAYLSNFCNYRSQKEHLADVCPSRCSAACKGGRSSGIAGSPNAMGGATTNCEDKRGAEL